MPIDSLPSHARIATCGDLGKSESPSDIFNVQICNSVSLKSPDATKKLNTVIVLYDPLLQQLIDLRPIVHAVDNENAVATVDVVQLLAVHNETVFDTDTL